MQNNLLVILLIFLHTAPFRLMAQERQRAVISLEDYFSDMASSGDDYLVLAEEWKDAIDHWLDHPLNVNSGDVDVLHEIGLISRYQLSKLKEYRMIYGDLLTVHEISMIEGWDKHTAGRIAPLVFAGKEGESAGNKKFSIKSLHQQLVVKTSFTAEKREGYRESTDENGVPLSPAYQGPPARLSLRYDLRYRRKITAGFRLEKDPGEPFLVREKTPWGGSFSLPDHYSGFLSIKNIKPFQEIILGDYQVRFGFGLTISPGNYGSLANGGSVSMAGQIRPKTSLQEGGYWRGVAATLRTGPFIFSAYGSSRRVDVSSPDLVDSTGKVLSFGSLNTSGLHRTLAEISKRKLVTENLAGGHLLFSNNWLKAGAIIVMNHFAAPVQAGVDLYEKFRFSGRSNLVAGLSWVAYLPRLQVFTEATISRNKGWAVLTGLGLNPAPGARIHLIFRKFNRNYQNPYGSGFVSASRNQDETGLRCIFNIELPGKSRIQLIADHSMSQWFRYQVDFPSSQTRLSGLFEKAWNGQNLIALSFHYEQNTLKKTSAFDLLDRQASGDRWRFRIEGRYAASESVRMKARLEMITGSEQGAKIYPGWLFLHDIAMPIPRAKLKAWLRVCLFQAMDYDYRMYAYENDVLYDFTSFMYYGKGARGVLMLNWEPLSWLEIWARYARVSYAGRTIGTGLEAIEGSQLNEFEFQVMLRDPF